MRPLADISSIAESLVMDEMAAGHSGRGRTRGLQVAYALMLIPASLLAYIGIGWVDAFERGWQTQVAAAALIAAWLALTLGLIVAWQTSHAGRQPKLIRGLAFFFAALGFYAVAFEWGGRMLI